MTDRIAEIREAIAEVFPSERLPYLAPEEILVYQAARAYADLLEADEK